MAEPFNPFFSPTEPTFADIAPVFPDPRYVLLGDTMPFYHEGVWHVFTCAPPVILHYSTADFLHWRTHPLVVRQGPTSADDKHWCATGTIVPHQGRFYFFYTGNQNICLAVSDDLDHWTKHADNPVVTGDDVTYNSQYFRDSFVFFNRQEGLWWMLLGSQVMRKPATRAGVVGLATSSDLLHWKLQPPLWAPRTGLSRDCPQMIGTPARWYLLYLERNCRYRVADSPRGPFRRPPVRNIGTSWAITLSRPGFDGKRWVAWPFICPTADKTDLGPWGYAGPLGIPRQFSFEGDVIAERPVDEMIAAVHALPDEAPALLTGAQTPVGQWQTSPAAACSLDAAGGTLLMNDAPADFYLETDVVFSCADMDAHILLRVDEGLNRGYEIALHPRTSQVSIRPVSLADVNRTMAYRSADLAVGKPNKVRLFVVGSVMEVFINNRISLTTRLYEHRRGALGLEFRDGTGEFSNLSVRRLKE